MDDERRRYWVFSKDNEQPETRISLPRLENFSDAVFGIAITLLVLTFDVPGRIAELNSGLEHQLDQLWAYLLSFIVVGRFWIAHHSLLAGLERPTSGLATLNVFYLATIVFIPFPTEIVGRYGGEFIALALYAVTIAIAVMMGLVVSIYIDRKGLRKPSAPRYRIDDQIIGACLPVSVFLLSIPLSLVLGSNAYWLWVLAFLINPSVRQVRASSHTG